MRRSMIATVVAASLALAACGGDDDSDAADESATESASATTDDNADAEGDGGTTDGSADDAGSGTTDAEGDGGTTDGSADINEVGPAPDPAACVQGNTVDEGVLTIATGEPAFPPYVLNDATPEDGQGFEAAVAMGVARELGFEADAVAWVRTAFDAAIAPGPKDFDFNLQQYTITPERAEVVDFSEGYYSAPQAIFGLADAAASGATTLDELKGLKIGVAAGTTSVTYVEEVIQPDAELLIFNDNAVREAGTREQSDRRDRERPPDGALHHRSRDRGHHRLRPDRGQRHRRVRSPARPGQPADRVREHGAREPTHLR